MTQYHVLASEGRQRYSIYTKTLKIYREKKNILYADARRTSKGESLTLLNISKCLLNPLKQYQIRTYYLELVTC
jgi:hypothetical protein